MDTEKFAEAQSLYEAGDYRKSARLFLESIEKGTPIGNGPAYHMAGNSFMRLKRFSDAAVVFEHALRDDTYQRRGAVEANLANAYIRTGDYSSAVAHYEAALANGDVEETYKYYVGMAQAYMQQNQYDHAAVAYKHAALDENNPQPGKALLNLGLAMMAAGNAKGAVEAYRAALSSPEYENKGRALLNMGVAYHAQGKWRDAIRCIEEAQVLHGYQDSALGQRIIAEARQRLAIEEQVEAADAALVDDAAADSNEELLRESPLDSYETSSSAWQEKESFSEDDYDGMSHDTLASGEDARFGRPEDVDRFFSRTEKEAAAAGRERARKARGKFRWLKIVAIVLLVLAVIAGGLAALYFTGQGYPTAEATVTSLLEEYKAGRSISQMWTTGAQDSIESQMIVVPLPASFTIDKIDRGASRTTVLVAVFNDYDDAFMFTFVLVREGIGWKIREVIPEGNDATIPDDADNQTDDPMLQDLEQGQTIPGGNSTETFVEEPVTGPEMQDSTP